jgi:hypothetical protein
MTDFQNAERLRKLHLMQTDEKPDRGRMNVCTARRNWNGCDYADVYAGSGLPCWRQDRKHDCIRCVEVCTE